MAKKRMFTMKIVDTDAFLDMPISAQCLYFHLNMRADDDGFVGNPKRIMSMIGAKEDDLTILKAKSFILSFDNGVIVIKHWRMHNTLSKNRYEETDYLDEKSMLLLKDNGSYSFTHGRLIDDGKRIKAVEEDDVEHLPNICRTFAEHSSNICRTSAEHLPNSGIGIGLDIDIDKELDLGVAQKPDPFFGMSDELRQAADDWIKYKAEKRQVYKPTGLKNLIAEIKNNATMYGDHAVAEVIRVSMSANYQGIVFDRLKNGRNQATGQNKTAQMLKDSYAMMDEWSQS